MAYSSLINNYISNANKSKTTDNSGVKKNTAQISTSSNLRPQGAKGSLLSSSIRFSPQNIVQEMSYEVKSLRNGLKGNANDHQLGKTNDLGLKISSLAIAAYLFTKKQAPMTKAMEFIGAASFFGSMALWPKLAFQLPQKLFNGVDVQKKYEDSLGREKPFFQDPQYIPWDLYNDKEIEKIGDKLGVAKDIPNRREFVQEKMKKIAVQSNTMWMLTAGFATPIMSALICNQAEPLVVNLQERLKMAKLKKMLKNINKEADNLAKKQDYQGYEKELNNILELNKDKPLNTKLFDKIVDVISPDLPQSGKEALKKDLIEKFINEKKEKYIIDGDVVDSILSVFKRNDASDSEFTDEVLSKIIPSKENFIELFNKRDKFNQELKIAEISELRDDVTKLLTKHIISLIPENASKEDILLNGINFEDALIYVKNSSRIDKVMEALKTKAANMLNTDAMTGIKNIAVAVRNFTKIDLAIKETSRAHVAKAPETLLANQWNSVADALVGILKITPKELEKAKSNRIYSRDLLIKKFDAITSNDDKYREVMKKLAEKIANMDTRIRPKSIDIIEESIDKLCNQVAVDFNEKGLHNLARKISNSLENDPIADAGTLKKLTKTFINEQISGVESSFYRFMSALDSYRRMSKGNLGNLAGEFLDKEVLEEVKRLAKHSIIDGHMSDFFTKFFTLRNPKQPEPNKQLDKALKAGVQKVDMPHDSKFFIEAMDLMFGNDIDSVTEEVLKDVGKKSFISLAPGKASAQKMSEQLRYYKKIIYEHIGSLPDNFKTRHMTVKNLDKKLGPNAQFVLLGKSPDELLHGVANRAYNTKKWLKTFGYFGAGLLGVTWASHLLFGKIETPKKVNEG